MPLLPADHTELLVRKIVELYKTAEDALLVQMATSVSRGIDADNWAEAQLTELARYRKQAEGVLAQLVADAKAAGDFAVERAVNRGQAMAMGDLADALTPELARTVGTVRDAHAITRLAQELTGSLNGMPPVILRSTNDIYRKVIADVSGQALLGSQTRREVAQRALGRFARDGITGFMDRKGRKWEMSSYVEMATRAVTMNAAIEGHSARLQATGHDLIIVSDVPQECRLCRPWEGKVLSLTGDVAGAITEDGKKVVGTLAQARAAGLFHPGCRHSISVYLPGITKSFGETADPQGDKDRQRLRLLERQVRAAHREELTALTPQAKKEAAAKVRAGQAAIRQHVKTTSAKRQPHRERASGEYRDVVDANIKREPTQRAIFDEVPLAHDILRGQQHTKLTEHERATIESHALGGYVRTNKALRGEIPMTPDIANRVVTIRQALEKYPLPKPVRVTREIDGVDFGFTNDTIVNTVGDTIDDAGFMSTSTLRQPPRSAVRTMPVTLEVLVPAGTPALRLGELSEFPRESEALLIDGRRMAIAGVYQEPKADQIGSRVWRILAIMFTEGGTP